MTGVGSRPLPTPEPVIEPGLEPFWEATARGELLLPRCHACATVFWYPRTICPACGAADVGWAPSAGRGVVHSFTVIRRGMGEYRECTPYALAYVELDEGVRILSNIVDVDVDQIAIGMPVEAAFHPTPSGVALLRFAPIASL